MSEPDTRAVDATAPAAVRRLIAVDRAMTAARNHIVRTVLHRYGVSWSGYLALTELGEHTDAVDHEPLAGRLGIALSTLSDILAALERAGLVHRQREPVQRRRVHIRLTDQGRCNLAAIHHDVACLAAQLADSIVGGPPGAASGSGSAGSATHSDPLDFGRPSAARRYGYWTHGSKDALKSDRESARQLAEVYPGIVADASENRWFMQRAVAALARSGVRDFLDVGAGMPQPPNVHELAQQVEPAARIVYVDRDPVAVAHLRALTVSTAQGTVDIVDADLRDLSAILDHPAVQAMLDRRRPVALLLLAVLHFLPDEQQPYDAVARLIQALPPGSYVALSHATFDPLPQHTIDALTTLAQDARHGPFQARTRDQVAAFLSGLDLLEPGLVPVAAWRPDPTRTSTATPAETAVYGAVGRLP